MRRYPRIGGCANSGWTSGASGLRTGAGDFHLSPQSMPAVTRTAPCVGRQMGFSVVRAQTGQSNVSLNPQPTPPRERNSSALRAVMSPVGELGESSKAKQRKAADQSSKRRRDGFETGQREVVTKQVHTTRTRNETTTRRAKRASSYGMGRPTVTHGDQLALARGRRWAGTRPRRGSRRTRRA